jgi:predicted translin family RNA/ssDNA-binding protein
MCCFSSLFFTVQFPQLRPGAFSNSIEEWGEGVLFLEWVKNKRIMGMTEMGLINSTEYVGALSDFTGEIGRLGVAAASRRDVAAVRAILQAIVAVAKGLMQLDTAGRFNKKTDAVLTNLKKMEDIYYELTMLKKGGKSGNIGSREEPAASSSAADA